MKIIPDDKAIQSLQVYRLGMLEAEVKVSPSPDSLYKLIFDRTEEITKQYALNEVNKHPGIAAAREAYKRCGNDPNRYRPSADSLLRRIVKGSALYQVNSVVDSLNLVSITSGISIGGYDKEKISGSVSLGIGKPREPYLGIGRGELNISNLPVLRDEVGAFGSPTSDSERTKISESTTQILFVFFDFGQDSELENYLKLTERLLIQYCDAQNIKISF